MKRRKPIMVRVYSRWSASGCRRSMQLWVSCQAKCRDTVVAVRQRTGFACC